ncbi:MAG: TRAP transporter permease [Firmicutes bacterium]|jgi:TRAP transporter 4TM/12TM fusion protein|nr:TRAP transporter permease [Bacillota bacterium]MDH7495228.1 TRAP transporter permease [Bacillota bacterium]
MVKYDKVMSAVLTAVSVAMALFHTYTALFGSLTSMWQRSIHLTFGFLLVYLMHSSKSKTTSAKLTGLGLSALGAATGIYVITNFDAIIMRFGSPNSLDLALAAVALLLVLDTARRTLGWAMPLIAIGFLLYAFLGPYLPGILYHRGYDLPRVLNQMYLTTEGIYGIPLGVSADYIFLFILFGSFLVATGAGQFYIDLAKALVGRARGGPAKVAIIASSLFGTISGSAQANVAGTGMITIPLMKNVGYRSEFAGAVEAAASTGGQIMPPVMGAAAFVMAEILGVPYVRIVQAAFIPALIYYTALLFSVDFEAARARIPGLTKDEIPNLRKVLREGWLYLVPLAAMIFLLIVVKWTTTKSAVYSLLATVIVGFLQHQRKFGLTEAVEAIRDGARGAISVITACSCAGVVVGIVNLTGLGLRFSNIVVSAAGGNVALLLVLIMLASLVLGMGLPTTPAYLVLAVLGVPALQTLGVPLLAAHMFIFYFGCISMITPPVALAVYVAAGIAKSSFWKTGINAVKLGVAAFIVPYFFIFNPPLLFEGTLPSVLWAGATAAVGAALLSGAAIGWFMGDIGVPERVVLLASALGLIDPGQLTNAMGLVGLALVVALQRFRATRSRSTRGGDFSGAIG